jgi:hypothetical protein
VKEFVVHEPQHLFYILTTGVYPTVAVTDARCGGSLISISKKHLWNLFSLDRYVERPIAFPEWMLLGLNIGVG